MMDRKSHAFSNGSGFRTLLNKSVGFFRRSTRLIHASMSVGDSASPSSSRLVTLQEIQEAHARILPHIHRTPLLTSTTLDAIATKRISNKLGNDNKIRIRLAFKSEHLQVIGAFKIRGATNAVKTYLARLQEEASEQQQGASKGKGIKFNPCKLCIVTHSSGNHAAAVACAAKNVGAKAAVVMPRTAPRTKKEAVAGYGARIVECEPTLEARESAAQALKDEIENDGSGMVVRFIHPYDEELVIAGQGTMGLEIIEQAHELQQGRRGCSAASNGIRDSDPKAWSKRSSEEPPLDFVVAPVGGGGMLSGVSTATRSLDDRIAIIGAEPKGEHFRYCESFPHPCLHCSP